MNLVLDRPELSAERASLQIAKLRARLSHDEFEAITLQSAVRRVSEEAPLKGLLKLFHNTPADKLGRRANLFLSSAAAGRDLWHSAFDAWESEL